MEELVLEGTGQHSSTGDLQPSKEPCSLDGVVVPGLFPRIKYCIYDDLFVSKDLKLTAVSRYIGKLVWLNLNPKSSGISKK